MYVQVQFLFNIMKYSNNFNFFSTQASQQRASPLYSWSTGLVDSTSNCTDLNSGDQFYQVQPYYCHPPQVSSLVLPRVYLASDFMALLEELDDEIGQQLAEM